MGMEEQKQCDVFISPRKKAKYAEHQCCSPNCHWHQLLRHRVAKSLGRYLLFWQLETSRKKAGGVREKMKGIIGVMKYDNFRV